MRLLYEAPPGRLRLVNCLALQELSNVERRHVQEAFSVVPTLQGVLQQRYQGGKNLGQFISNQAVALIE